MVKFQSDKSSVLTPDLRRSWKSTIWKCLSFFKIPSGSASKMDLKVLKVGKFQYLWTYPRKTNQFLLRIARAFWKYICWWQLLKMKNVIMMEFPARQFVTMTLTWQPNSIKWIIFFHIIVKTGSEFLNLTTNVQKCYL